METISPEVLERVNNGVNFLDAHAEVFNGDWRQRVNPATLDLSKCTVCVMGQIAGEFYRGCQALGIAPYRSDRFSELEYNAIELGFNVEEAEGLMDFEKLTEAWKYVLANPSVADTEEAVAWHA